VRKLIFFFPLLNHYYRPNGTIFPVSLDSVNIPTPMKGDVVTFSYEIQSRREMPSNPSIVRKRTDISWEDVLDSSLTEKKFLNGTIREGRESICLMNNRALGNRKIHETPIWTLDHWQHESLHDALGQKL
jgi:hypothetical protein